MSEARGEVPPTMDADRNDILRMLRLQDEQQRSQMAVRDDVNALKLQYNNIARDLGNLQVNMKADLTQFAADIKSSVNQLSEAHGSLQRQFDESRRTNWPVLLTAGGLLLSLFGLGLPAMVFLANSNTENKLTPLTLSMATIVQNQKNNNEDLKDAFQRLDSVSRDVNGLSEAKSSSRADREQLNDRIRGLESRVQGDSAQRREQNATVKADLVEIETQFKATTQFLALMWEKVFKQRFPSDVTRETPR